MDSKWLQEASCIRRYAGNPVLSWRDVPYNAALTMNAGAAKFNGKYVMLFRNDYGDVEQKKLSGTNMGLATSDDGLRWTVAPEPVWQIHDEEVGRVYDPRITVLDGRAYVCFAQDTRHGVRGGIAVTDDFHRFEILTLTAPDNRNMVLFPEKIGGQYVRLERPFPVYSRGGRTIFDIWMSRSPDLRYWGDTALVLDTEHVPFCNDKIGPGAPPIRTKKGWLTTFHAVATDVAPIAPGWEGPGWNKQYMGGIMLLDLEDPSRVIGMSKYPLIAPNTSYECEGGFRNNVIFPGGMILEDSGEVKIYYGCADAVECLFTADVDELLALCCEQK